MSADKPFLRGQTFVNVVPDVWCTFLLYLFIFLSLPILERIAKEAFARSGWVVSQLCHTHNTSSRARLRASRTPEVAVPACEDESCGERIF